jgi:baculoviral IAP repeat-containing protein 6
MGTPEGTNRSDVYNRNIEEQTIRWGMIDIMKNPPAHFEDIIRIHFTSRQTQILEQVQKWAVNNAVTTTTTKYFDC